MIEEKRLTEIKNLKVGSYVLMEDDVCKVDSLQISKSGKHGSAKARLVGTGVFSNKKHTIVAPGSTRLNVPIIEKKTAQVISVTDELAQLMDLVDYSTFNVPIPEELKGQLQSGDEVLIWQFGKNILIKSKK